MQSRIDSFLNDFYADIDSGEDPKYVADRYFEDDILLIHMSEKFKGADDAREWYVSIQSGFSNSMHQIKGVEYADLGDVIAVQADVVWTAAFKNMDGNNMIRYKMVVRFDLTDDNGTLRIKAYRSTAVK